MVSHDVHYCRQQADQNKENVTEERTEPESHSYGMGDSDSSDDDEIKYRDDDDDIGYSKNYSLFINTEYRYKSELYIYI